MHTRTELSLQVVHLVAAPCACALFRTEYDWTTVSSRFPSVKWCSVHLAGTIGAPAEEIINSGVSQEVLTHGTFIVDPDTHDEMYDDALSEVEKDLICGVYKMFTGMYNSRLLFLPPLMVG